MDTGQDAIFVSRDRWHRCAHAEDRVCRRRMSCGGRSLLLLDTLGSETEGETDSLRHIDDVCGVCDGVCECVCECVCGASKFTRG